MSRKKRKENIVLKKRKLRTGHSSHRSGAGTHKDKRTKRLRTRNDAKRKAIEENS